MRFKRFIAASLLLVVFLAACGGNPDESLEATAVPETITEPTAETIAETGTAENEGLPFVDPLSVSGDIVTAGSSTVFPLSERMAERFIADASKGGDAYIRRQFDFRGSKLFGQGGTDCRIANRSHRRLAGTHQMCATTMIPFFGT